jgi:hypothetical protein
MLELGVPVGAGTDATRVASYNPWVSLDWLVTGRTVGGLGLYPERARLDRETALRLWTHGSAWFSGEDHSKGVLAPGRFADLAVLSDDYMSVPGADIQHLSSVLTVSGGRIVYGAGPFRGFDPPLPPPSPDWSPVKAYGGHWSRADSGPAPAAGQRDCGNGCASDCGVHGHAHRIAWTAPIPADDRRGFWGALGCSCFAV